jgi:hypothetical protein
MSVLCVRRLLAAVPLVLASSLGTMAQGPPAGYPPDQVPGTLNPAVRRAEAAFAALQGGLLRRLQDATRAGPAAAVDVCRVEAPAIAVHVAEQQKVAIGGTSHLLRNPKNAPPSWATATVAEAAGQPAAAVRQRVFDLGDTVGVLRPIPMGLICTNCHGPAESLGADVCRALQQGYPHDKAVGFKEGDLRGWMWAEVPRQPQP